MKRGEMSKTKVALLLAAVVVIGSLSTYGIKPANLRPELNQADAAGNQSLSQPADFSQIVKRLQPGVVTIKVETSETAPLPENHPQIPPGIGHIEGSGIVIDKKGVILTNNHVVSRSKKIQVVFFNKKKYAATVIGRDPGFDLAVIKIKISSKTNLTTVPLGDSNKTKTGEWVIAMGDPLGLENNVTVGIISGKKRELPELPLVDFIQTDAGIYPGSSGGPLVDSSGKAVAINTAAIPDTKIGLSVPINAAKKIIPRLEKSGDISRGFLGLLTIDPQKDANMENQTGALVDQIEPGGAADKAGIKEGDIIISFNGKDVKNPRGFAQMEAESKPGSNVQITVDRAGKDQPLTLTMGKNTD